MNCKSPANNDCGNKSSEKDSHGRSVDSKALPSYEEYNDQVTNVQNTKLGALLPILPSEYKRVILSVLCYFSIGLTYSFSKHFKDSVIYDVYADAGVITWFEPLVFIPAFQIIKGMDTLVKRVGVNRAINIFMVSVIGAYGFCVLCILFDRFVTGAVGWSSEAFYLPALSIRNLTILKYPMLLINNIGITTYYIILETINSYMISCLFMTYLSSNTTHGQIKRFIYPIFLGCNISLFFAMIMVSGFNKVINKISIVSTNWIFYILSLGIITMLTMCTFGLKHLLDGEFKKALYIGETQQEAKAKDKTKITMFKAFKTVIKTPWLLGISCMGMFYGITSTILSTMNSFVYTSHAEYLQQNPSANKVAGFIPSASNVAMKYKSMEGKLTSVISVIFLIFPIFKVLFNKVGILGYNSIVVVACACPMAVMYILASINYPFTNCGESIFMGFKTASATPRFDAESLFCAFSSLMNKVAKYSFYDLIKENVTAKIDPMNKVLYKGIFDGLAPKIGKIIGTIYAIVVTSLPKGDARYYSFVSVMIFSVIGIVWGLVAIRLHNAYRHAVKTDSYLGAPITKEEPLKEPINKVEYTDVSTKIESEKIQAI